MRVAILSPISWRTPPQHYGPWESVVSVLTEQLVSMGVDVTLFATGDSITSGHLESVCKHALNEDTSLDPKVWECLHISNLIEQSDQFDLIHNHYDFLPLSYAGLLKKPVLTTIHGFSCNAILPVYRKYNATTYFAAISEADKNPDLDYAATIHHGIELSNFSFNSGSRGYLLFFGRIHHEKGVYESIQVAKHANKKLVIAGIIQDQDYFKEKVEPYIDGKTVEYLGPVYAENKSNVLGEADALLHLINFDEPFGLSMIEAMACGTPVIAVGRGSIPEVVEDGKTGFIVENIKGAVEAVVKLGSISRLDCRSHVEERFTATRMAQNYLDLYRRILEKRLNYRPWGYYEILSDAETHKVKRIELYPGQQFSLQKHQRRDEQWTIVKGKAEVDLDGNTLQLTVGQSIKIPRGATHRLRNPGDTPVVFIEVQTGDYFGEDDIVRLQDDYGRA